MDLLGAYGLLGFGTTHHDYLVVSIVVKNLVGIDAVVSIIGGAGYEIFDILPVWLVDAYSRPQNWGFGDFTPNMGSSKLIDETPKRQTPKSPCASPRR